MGSRRLRPDGMLDIPGNYSPDGPQVLFIRRPPYSDASRIMLVGVAGGEARLVWDVGYAEPGRFAPDGNSIVTSAQTYILQADLGAGMCHEERDGVPTDLCGREWRIALR